MHPDLVGHCYGAHRRIAVFDEHLRAACLGQLAACCLFDGRERSLELWQLTNLACPEDFCSALGVVAQEVYTKATTVSSHGEEEGKAPPQLRAPALRPAVRHCTVT